MASAGEGEDCYGSHFIFFAVDSFFAGVTWIGILYYFNFVQTPFFAETDAPVRTGAIQKLVPRALWWFRWGAMFTFLAGLLILFAHDCKIGGELFFPHPTASRLR